MSSVCSSARPCFCFKNILRGWAVSFQFHLWCQDHHRPIVISSETQLTLFVTNGAVVSGVGNEQRSLHRLLGVLHVRRTHVDLTLPAYLARVCKAGSRLGEISGVFGVQLVIDPGVDQVTKSE